MLIDCDTCAVRGPACDDCVVGVLLKAPPAAAQPGAIELDGPERAAIAVLAGAGLVPPLRLVPVAPDQPDPHQPDLHREGPHREGPHPEGPPGRIRSA